VLDKPVVQRHLLDLERTVSALRRLQGLTVDELERSLEKQWAVEHGLQLAIQNVLDIGNQLLLAAGVTNIEDYADIIDRMGGTGILPPDFARVIRPMVGFRNVLVHAYTRIDLTRVHQMLHAHLQDFETFAQHIRRHLDRQPGLRGILRSPDHDLRGRRSAEGNLTLRGDHDREGQLFRGNFSENPLHRQFFCQRLGLGPDRVPERKWFHNHSFRAEA
jgi:uncharacterized protein YutE (UPF0331/DUF86 family)